MKKIPLSAPVFWGEEEEKVAQCINTGWVSTAGPAVDDFEQSLQRYLGEDGHVVVVNSGTSALHLAVLAMGVEAGDEVIVPALTFIASVNPIRYVGAFPVFIDVSLTDGHLDLEKLESFLRHNCIRRNGEVYNKNTQRRVRAIIPVHLLGNALQVNALRDLLIDFPMRIIEDAAEALGATVDGELCGTIGDIGCFSFNGNKIITAGSGGAIFTRDKAVAKKCRLLANQAKESGFDYNHQHIGYNYRLNSLSAAIGNAQLKNINRAISERKRVASKYNDWFNQDIGIRPFKARDFCESNYWLYTIFINNKIDLRKLVVSLCNEGIQARPLWNPIYQLNLYREYESFCIENTDLLFEHSLSLPSSANLLNEDIDYVCNRLIELLNA